MNSATDDYKLAIQGMAAALHDQWYDSALNKMADCTMDAWLQDMMTHPFYYGLQLKHSFAAAMVSAEMVALWHEQLVQV